MLKRNAVVVARRGPGSIRAIGAKNPARNSEWCGKWDWVGALVAVIPQTTWNLTVGAGGAANQATGPAPAGSGVVWRNRSWSGVSRWWGGAAHNVRIVRHRTRFPSNSSEPWCNVQRQGPAQNSRNQNQSSRRERSVVPAEEDASPPPQVR